MSDRGDAAGIGVPLPDVPVADVPVAGVSVAGVGLSQVLLSQTFTAAEVTALRHTVAGLCRRHRDGPRPGLPVRPGGA